jgi:hypothetical protein
VQLSVGQATNVWGVTAADGIWRWHGAKWRLVEGVLRQVSVGTDGSVWGVNRAGAIFRRKGERWQSIPGELVQLSVGRDNNVWGVNSAGQIWRWDGTRWALVDGELANVAVAADGTVWGVNRAGAIFRRSGDQWRVVQGVLVQVSVASSPVASSPVASSPADTSIPISLNQNLNIQAPTTVIQQQPIPNIQAPTTPILLQGQTGIAVSPPPTTTTTATRVQDTPLVVGTPVLPYAIGPVGASKATCGASGLGLCAPTVAVFVHNASIDCPAGTFTDVGLWSCWSCPAGYQRSTAPVDGERACQQSDPTQAGGFLAATFGGPLCPAGSFYDLVRGGECYTCPGGYNRSAAPIDAANACYVAATEVFSKPTRGRNTIWPTDCAAGQFHDLWDGGACWSCPSGYNRSAYPVYDQHACSKAVAEQQAHATVLQKAECGPGEFFDMKIAGTQDISRGGGCWACPTGADRTIFPVDEAKACERAPGFRYARATKARAMTCETTEIFDPVNSDNANVRGALNLHNAIPGAAQVTPASSGGTCWTCPPGSKRTTNTVFGGSACQPTGIAWKSAPYNQPGLFGLDGAEAVALKLVAERTTINNIIAGIKEGADAGSLPANFAQITWDEIGNRPQDSAVLKIAVFSRVVAAATQPASATPEEAELLASVIEHVRKFRVFMAQDALDAYQSWNTNRDYRSGMYLRSQLQSMTDLGEVPPDFEQITAETIFGSLTASGGASTAIGLALTSDKVFRLLFPHAQRVFFRAAPKLIGAASTAARAGAAGTRVGVELAKAGAEVGGGLSGIAVSIGPQIIVTFAIEVLAVAIEQQIDIANAEPKLRTGLATASNYKVDFVRLMATPAGTTQAESYWANLMAGPAALADGSRPPKAAPKNTQAFAQLAAAAKAAL